MECDYFGDSKSAMNIESSELDEVWDEIEMIEHCEIIEKSQLFDSEYDDQLYDICVRAEKTESQSLRPFPSSSSTLCPVQIGLGNMDKRSIETEDGNKDVKRARVEEPSTSTDTDKLSHEKSIRIQRSVPGGVVEKDPYETKYYNLADLAMKRYGRESNKSYYILEVTRVTEQVVAGLITEIDFYATPTYCPSPSCNVVIPFTQMNCHSSILQQYWMLNSDVSTKCDPA